MKEIYGIISTNIKNLDNLEKVSNNTYIFICINNMDEIDKHIDFLISNNCKNIFFYEKDIKQKIKINKNSFNEIKDIFKIKSCSTEKRIIVYNYSNKKYYNKKKYIYNFKKLNLYRKDKTPSQTIKIIKKILKTNKIKIKKKYIIKKQNMYSVRLILNNNKGVNGKGLSLKLAKASAYAELMERLQSNMINKKRINTSKIDKKNTLFDALLYKANDEYKRNFFKLDNIYFNVEKCKNLKTNKTEYIPINSINAFCHTNGLASGNTFSEAINQAIFEIFERHSYQTLLNSNIPVKNIDINKYPINATNSKILKKISKKGYTFQVKDCSLGQYPCLGFLLYDKTKEKYTFTMASDISFDIALSRAITEMFQGFTLKNIELKMLDMLDINELEKTYQNNFKSYNWLKCFNNNNGYLSSNFFNNDYVDIKNLPFKNYMLSNEEILKYNKGIINKNIYIIEYNKLGFNTYRVYIPYITEVDCYNIEDLEINKNYNELFKIYTNIEKCNTNEINFFIDIFMQACKNLKYDDIIKPVDLFHLNETSDYYKLDFTSLLFILCLINNRIHDITTFLEFKLNYSNLTQIKLLTYKIMINKLNDKKIYDIKNINIEKDLDEIINNARNYIKKIKTKQNFEYNKLFIKK